MKRKTSQSPRGNPTPSPSTFSQKTLFFCFSLFPKLFKTTSSHSLHLNKRASYLSSLTSSLPPDDSRTSFNLPLRRIYSFLKILLVLFFVLIFFWFFIFIIPASPSSSSSFSSFLSSSLSSVSPSWPSFLSVKHLHPKRVTPSSSIVSFSSIFSSPCSPEWRSQKRQENLTTTCWAKEERKCFAPIATNEAPPEKMVLLKKLLKEFEIRQRKCTNGVKDWFSLVKGLESPPDPTCKYVVADPNSHGLGNRIFTVISSFLYALLTNRAFLVDDDTFLQLLCEPVLDASWQIPDSSALEHLHSVRQNGAKLGSYVEDFERGSSKNLVVLGIHLAFRATWEDHVFYCDRGQVAIENIPWLIITTEQYLVPGFFLIPKFREKLELLFPDKKPFLHLSRFLLHPNNYLWERITRLYETKMGDADQRIGIQVRTFVDNDDYASERILQCLTNITNTLPVPIPSETWGELWRDYRKGNVNEKWKVEEKTILEKVVFESRPEKIGVLVTSLNPNHAEDLRRLYDYGVSENGTIVNIISFSGEGAEHHSIENDERAFTEIILLSLCDRIFISDVSTFGNVAAGMLGRTPYTLNIRGFNYFNNGRPFCEKLESSEPCYHFYPHKRPCKTTNSEVRTTWDPDPNLNYFVKCIELTKEPQDGRRMWNPMATNED